MLDSPLPLNAGTVTGTYKRIKLLHALIDADLVCYRSAASCKEDDSVNIAIIRTDSLMQQLLHETTAETYQAFLSGGENFRKKIDPQYKANRKDMTPPKWLQECREFLVTEYGAQVTDGIEADDAMGIAQDKENGTTCIVSLDKDMLQIPGHHYRWAISGHSTSSNGMKDWTKEAEWLNVSYIEGLRSFYISSLVGDVSDNIRGAAGIGKAKAPRILAGMDTEREMYEACKEMYNGEVDRFHTNLSLLWIMRTIDDFYCPVERGLT
jgi:5'-3' exonuclease